MGQIMKLGIGWDVITHAGTGMVALVAGALMGQSSLALWLFSALMLISAISALWISWRQNAWVTGHWLAMLPIIGIGVGIFIDPTGFTAAYVMLWIAFLHFLYRGWQSTRTEQP